MCLLCLVVPHGAVAIDLSSSLKLPTLLSSSSGVSRPVKRGETSGECAGLRKEATVSLKGQLEETLPTRHQVLRWGNGSDYLTQWSGDLASEAAHEAGTDGDAADVGGGKRKRLPYDFTSCAVVGNGGILRANAVGPAIDSHAAVWRLNQAPTKGYERLVGKKTTFRVLNKTWLAKYANRINKDWLPFETDVTLVNSRGNPGTVRGMFNLYGPTATAPLRSRVRVADMHGAVGAATSKAMREFRRQVRCGPMRKTFHGGNTPSSGILTVLMALTLCKRTTVYGFGNEPGGSKFGYQYYRFLNTERPGGDAVHSFDAEKALAMQLGRDGYVEFCSGSRYGRGVHCGCPPGVSCGDKSAASDIKEALKATKDHESGHLSSVGGVKQKGLYALKRLGSRRAGATLAHAHHAGHSGR